MRTSSIVTLAVAITMGVVEALLARSWMQSQQHASADGVTGTIVVAAAPLTFGTTITEDKIALRELLEKGSDSRRCPESAAMGGFATDRFWSAYGITDICQFGSTAS